MRQIRKPAAIAVAGAFALLAAAMQPAFAQSETDKLRAELEQLKVELRELRAAMNRQQKDSATKQEVQAVQAEVRETRSRTDDSGMLGRNTVAHLAGYGDVGYASVKDGARGFNAATFNPIFHFQYKDALFFETELETKVQADGTTDVGLEYANLNYFLNDNVTLFAGKFLSPLGYFRQNLHPSWINKFASAPTGFGHEGAAPTSDVGAGARGGFYLGAMKANYALYVGNGPRLELNGAGDEIEAIEAEGSTSNPGNKSFVGGRFGLHPLPNLQLGVSAGSSKVAVEAPAGIEPTRSYRVEGADFAFQQKGFDLRGEYVRQRVGDHASSVAPEGGAWSAHYLQAAYRFAGTGWEPVVRWGKFRSPHSDQRQRQTAFGVNYWISANAVVKLGVENNRGLAGTATDRDRTLIQFAYGF